MYDCLVFAFDKGKASALAVQTVNLLWSSTALQCSLSSERITFSVVFFVIHRFSPIIPLRKPVSCLNRYTFTNVCDSPDCVYCL